MEDDSILDEKRQKLFALVWERPASEVASELGMSDVALGKLCRRLQVPKPPRGYWARLASGKTPKRPPLQAYRAEVERRIRNQARSTSQVPLTKLQLKFLNYALNELADSGVDISCSELAYDGIRSISPELAANLLILLQNNYEKWLRDRTSVVSKNAAMSSLSNLVAKLLAHAKEQLLLFHRKSDSGYSGSDGPVISVRATQDFYKRIAHLSNLARQNGLAYVVADMSALQHAWSINRIYTPKTNSSIKMELCVSSHEIWIRGEIEDNWRRDRYETIQIPLRQICPVDLVRRNEERLPPIIRRSEIKPYAERLQALQEAQTIFDMLVNAAYDIERTIPNEKLALFDRLWFSKEGTGPFVGARRAWHRLEADLDNWERSLESESVSLCQEILGIEIGDIVVAESGKSLMRLKIEGMSAYSSGERIMFSVWGKRFRKDGLPGKRTDQFSIILENDLETG